MVVIYYFSDEYDPQYTFLNNCCYGTVYTNVIYVECKYDEKNGANNANNKLSISMKENNLLIL